MISWLSSEDVWSLSEDDELLLCFRLDRGKSDQDSKDSLGGHSLGFGVGIFSGRLPITCRRLARVACGAAGRRGWCRSPQALTSVYRHVVPENPRIWIIIVRSHPDCTRGGGMG